MNTGGGIVGGDRLETVVTALADASATITSQAAERVYRALKEPARLTTRLTVCATATLAWLPQETIIFDGARFERSTEIELSPGAELLALEWLVLGRAAHGEKIAGGRITDGWRVKIDGRLIWADSFQATDEVFPRLQCRALLADFKAIGTLVYFGPDLDAQLQLMRELSPSLKCQCVATTIASLLIARFAAEASVDLKDRLRTVLAQFGRTRSTAFRPPKMWSG